MRMLIDDRKRQCPLAEDRLYDGESHEAGVPKESREDRLAIAHGDQSEGQVSDHLDDDDTRNDPQRLQRDGVAVQADEDEGGQGDIEHKLADTGGILRREDMEPTKQDADGHDEDKRKHRTHFRKTDRCFHILAMIAEKRHCVQPWVLRISWLRGQNLTVVFPYPLVKSLRYAVGDHKVMVQE